MYFISEITGNMQLELIFHIYLQDFLKYYLCPAKCLTFQFENIQRARIFNSESIIFPDMLAYDILN